MRRSRNLLLALFLLATFVPGTASARPWRQGTSWDDRGESTWDAPVRTFTKWVENIVSTWLKDGGIIVPGG
jgi:hypothetical protein